VTTGQISFIDPEVQRCPFPAYAEIRQHGPVYYDASCNFFIVTGYDEVRAAANDVETFSSVTGQLLVKQAPYQPKVDAIYREHGFLPVNTLVVADAPAHTFHRALVEKAFTISRVRKMEDYIRTIVDEMIDSFAGIGNVEFHHDFAMKVPTFVIADQLGVPRANFDTFKRWSDAVISEGDPNNGEARQMELTLTICELQNYIARMADQYLAAPADCMLSDLARAEDNGRRIDKAELVSMVIQILVAGNDTTTSAMASAMYRMIQTPGLEDRLRENPEAIGNYIEEILRMESPVQGLYRRATRDTQIAGVDIPEGSIIILRFGAANRDPAQFPDPDRLEAGRSNARTHLTFGTGPHFCIGNQLARGELRIAFASLLKRLCNFRLAQGDSGVARLSHFFGYGLTRLEIAFDRI
jgi:cytochrome P450